MGSSDTHPDNARRWVRQRDSQQARHEHVWSVKPASAYEFVFSSNGQAQSLVCPPAQGEKLYQYASWRVGSRSLATHDGGRGQPRSRRDEIRFTPEEQASFLSQPHKAALATIDKEGFPHVVAMGYRYKDGVIYMTYYGKAQKVVNVRRNPKVGVMVEVGERYAENTSADSLIERRSGDEGFSWPRLPGKFPEIA